MHVSTQLVAIFCVASSKPCLVEGHSFPVAAAFYETGTSLDLEEDMASATGKLWMWDVRGCKPCALHFLLEDIGYN